MILQTPIPSSDMPFHQQSPNKQHQTIVKAYTQGIRQGLKADPNLIPYFVTTTFCDFEMGDKRQFKHRVDYIQRQYDRVYRHLVSLLMNNFPDKLPLHPRTFDFVDLANTRRSNKINIQYPINVHIHSIYLVNRKTLIRFEELLQDEFKQIVGHRSFQAVLVSIHALPINETDLQTVVSYASKLLRNPVVSAYSGEVDLYWQYPITKDEQKIRRGSLRDEINRTHINIWEPT